MGDGTLRAEVQNAVLAGEPGETWDVDQVSAYLKVPRATLYRWRTAGSGSPARRVGRHLRYKSSEVVDWFD